MSSGEINKKRLFSTDNQISKLGFENSSARWVKESSVLIALAGQGKTRGTVAINEIPLTTNQSIAAIEPDDKLDSEFLFQNLEKRYEELRLASSGDGSRGGLNKQIISDLKIIAPSVKEQTKIGSFFKQLDNTIALHQRKIVALKQMKKGFLQQLFPKNQKHGENIPKLRFTDFKEEWELRKLDDVVEFYSGLTYSPDNVQTEGTFVLRSSNVKNGEIVDADNVYVSHDVVNSDNVQEGDVIVVVRNGSRDLIGKHAQIKKQMDNTVIGAFMTGVRSETPDFTNALLDTQQFTIEINKNLGATINQITTGAFKKMQFVVPKDKGEREAIGIFFRSIDDLITLHQNKLDQLNKLKTAFLQNMFI